MSMDMKISGLKELDQRLGSLSKKLQRRAVLNTMRPSARMVLKEIKRMAPVKTGAHKKSLKVKTVPISKTARHSMEVKIIGGHKANWLEYGTRMQPAQPHFRPAADSLEGAAQKVMVDGIVAMIDKVMA